MERIIERDEITHIIKYDYFMVDMNLDMKADVEISFEIDGKEYKTEFKYKHRNEINRLSMIGCSDNDIEEIRMGRKYTGVYLTADEVVEDISYKMLGHLYDVTEDEAIHKRIDTDKLTVYINIKNIELSDNNDLSENIKENYKRATKIKEIDAINAVVASIKQRTGCELGLFSIEMIGSSNRVILEGRCGRVENAKLKRRQGGLCMYTKVGFRMYEEADYTCLLVNGDDYELITYKGAELDNGDMYELFKTDNDRLIRKLIIME